MKMTHSFRLLQCLIATLATTTGTGIAQTPPPPPVFPPVVATITPTTGYNDQSVAVTVTGANFASGASLMLTRSGESTITATSVRVASTSTISGVLDIRGKTAGAWNVVVRNTNGKSGTLWNGFTIYVRSALQITTASPLPGGVVGQSYGITLTATGGLPPYTWRIATGSSLPPGLLLSTLGYLYGTPSAASTYTFTLQVTDSAVPAAAVSKQFSLTVSGVTRQPDMLIRKSNVTTYTGDNIYNTTGANQTVQQTIGKGQTVVYVLKLQNDGSASDSFVVQGTKAPTGWTVRYYNKKSGGTDVTSAVTRASGGTSPVLGAGAAGEFRVEVTPGTSVATGASLDVLVTATSKADATRKDAIKATTTTGTAASALQAVTLERFAMATTTVSRGQTIMVHYTLHNSSATTQQSILFRLRCAGKVVGTPKLIRALAAGSQVSGTFRLNVPRNAAPGEHLLTGEILAPHLSQSSVLDRQTLRFTVY